jgi:hypothetical protein
LLGQDFFEQKHIDADAVYKDHEFKIGGVTIPIYAGNDQKWCARIAAAETCTIPGNHEVVIKSKLARTKRIPRGTTVCCLKGTINFGKKHNLLVAGEVVDISTGTVYTRVYNPSEDDLKVYRGTNMAVISPILMIGVSLDESVPDDQELLTKETVDTEQTSTTEETVDTEQTSTIEKPVESDSKVIVDHNSAMVKTTNSLTPIPEQTLDPPVVAESLTGQACETRPQKSPFVESAEPSTGTTTEVKTDKTAESSSLCSQTDSIGPTENLFPIDSTDKPLIDLKPRTDLEELELTTSLKTMIDNIDSSVTREQKSELARLIVLYRDAFSKNDWDLGRTSLTEHVIPLKDPTPVREPLRKSPYYIKEELEAHIHEMEDAGIIQPSESPWRQQIVPVQKSDGKWRICVDYRKINEKTIKDAYPMPRIEENLDALSGSKWFSSLDLTMGYHQVPMAEADKPKTAFSAPS